MSVDNRASQPLFLSQGTKIIFAGLPSESFTMTAALILALPFFFSSLLYRSVNRSFLPFYSYSHLGWAFSIQITWMCFRRLEMTEGIENQLSITTYFALTPISRALVIIGSSRLVVFVVASSHRLYPQVLLSISGLIPLYLFFHLLMITGQSRCQENCSRQTTQE